MPLVSLNEVLDGAMSHGYAVGAFNVPDFNILRGVILAAEQEKSPVIISLGQGQFRFTPPEMMVPIMCQFAEKSSVPVVVHLDHAKTIDVCERGIACGFSSVMFDGSHYPFDENIALTKKVVEIAHKKGITVEGEVGQVQNAETGDIVDPKQESQSCQFASVDEACEFYHETGVDALAVAFGTAHGLYHGVPKLNFELLKQVQERIRVPLVMHGSSGLPDEMFRKAIEAGVRKINYFSVLSYELCEQAKDFLNQKDTVYYHELQLLVIEQTCQHVSRLLRIFGSNNKA